MPSPVVYVAFLTFVVVMLWVDLKLFHADARESSIKEAAVWVGIWIALAVIFGLILGIWQGSHHAAEFASGYLIEYSLSIDNMFVFIVIFNYFQVPAAYQHRVLFFGILGAIIFRGLFIFIGSELLERFEWVIYVLGVLLILTAYRVVRGTSEVNPENNPVLRFFRKRFRTHPGFEGQRLFTRIDGERVATALFVVLLVVETTDILFAVDSIPAIFAITRNAFIVLTSNVFAILGLRALYFLLSGTMAKLHLLKYGLAAILTLVGIKMLISGLVVIPVWLSLAVIVAVLAITAFASAIFPQRRTTD